MRIFYAVTKQLSGICTNIPAGRNTLVFQFLEYCPLVNEAQQSSIAFEMVNCPN